jgi:flagellar protein FlgJ
MISVGPIQHPLGKAARPDPRASQEDQLRGTAQSLQGVFVEQLFKAMRDTVPEDGLMSGGQGEDMFRSMMDQHVAELAPQQWNGPHSLGDAIVRQLSQTHASAPAVKLSPDSVAP